MIPAMAIKKASATKIPGPICRLRIQAPRNSRTQIVTGWRGVSASKDESSLYSFRKISIGTVRLLAERLDKEGIGTPRRTSTTGRDFGGVPFSRGQLGEFLGNPT
jgi:hypothetical protein